MNKRIVTILALGLAAGSPAARANGYRSIARELGAAARRASISRVAVLPFEPADDSARADGWGLSEKLVTQLVRGGKVQAVERAMLHQLFEEDRLGETGALAPDTLRKLGRVLAAQGIVTGSFVTVGSEVVVDARLIDAETGVILGACEKKVDRQWFGDDAAAFVPAPELIAPVPRLVEERDGCDGASERVDGLERQVLDLKARYWALRLKRGLDLRTLKRSPGSTISDPGLRRAFYERLKAYHSAESVPHLAPTEVKRLVSVDGAAYSLAQDCGI